jgi:hypothetical protein
MMAEVEFRTGKRVIPDYMAELMAGIQTHKMTYDQAVAAMNKKLESNVIDRASDQIINEHFARATRR